MKKIAVCGGVGKIGNALCEKLRARGHHVVAYDRNITIPRDQMFANELHVFDLCNDQDYFAAFRWHEFDEVYNVVGAAKRHILSAEELYNRALVALNVLEVCRKSEVKTLWFGYSIAIDSMWLQALHAAYRKQYGMDIKPIDT